MMTSRQTEIKPQEEFIRQVLFLIDNDKVLAVLPFYHDISDLEYETVVATFDDAVGEDIPPKNEFCLMNEEEFGWGWIHNKMINYLEIATFEEYNDLQSKLVNSKVIKKDFILNLDME